MKITMELIESMKSTRGGYTAKTLRTLGVSWPPKKGWKQRIIGKEIKHATTA